MERVEPTLFLASAENHSLAPVLGGVGWAGEDVSLPLRFCFHPEDTSPFGERPGCQARETAAASRGSNLENRPVVPSPQAGEVPLE